jgi:hypothetical protein
MKALLRFIGWCWATPWAIFGPFGVFAGLSEGQYGAAAAVAGFTVLGTLIVWRLWRTRPITYAGSSTKDDLSL